MATRLDAAYDAAVLDVRSKVLAYARQYWETLPQYRDAEVEQLVTELVPRVEAGQVKVAQLTDAYIARVAAAETGRPITRGTVADVSTEALRGVPSGDVYRRPFASTWTALSTGAAIGDAIQAGLTRLTDITAMDLQLAKTHAARTAMKRAGVEQYQRVLTGRESCALCIVASTQRYHRANLLPCHPGCDCTVKPYYGPDVQVINPDVLDQVHGAALDRFGLDDAGARDIGLGTGRDYQHLLVTHEHGEIGPVLAVRGQTFTGPDDL